MIFTDKAMTMLRLAQEAKPGFDGFRVFQKELADNKCIEDSPFKPARVNLQANSNIGRSLRSGLGFAVLTKTHNETHQAEKSFVYVCRKIELMTIRDGNVEFLGFSVPYENGPILTRLSTFRDHSFLLMTKTT